MTFPRALHRLDMELVRAHATYTRQRRRRRRVVVAGAAAATLATGIAGGTIIARSGRATAPIVVPGTKEHLPGATRKAVAPSTLVLTARIHRYSVFTGRGVRRGTVCLIVRDGGTGVASTACDTTERLHRRGIWLTTPAAGGVHQVFVMLGTSAQDLDVGRGSRGSLHGRIATFVAPEEGGDVRLSVDGGKWTTAIQLPRWTAPQRSIHMGTTTTPHGSSGP